MYTSEVQTTGYDGAKKQPFYQCQLKASPEGSFPFWKKQSHFNY
jgi:hypothetical protein